MRREKDIFPSYLRIFCLLAALADPGCAPGRLQPRRPGLWGLRKDWTDALAAADPRLLARIVSDTALSRPPGIRFVPAARPGGRLLLLLWTTDPKAPLAEGLLGQLQAYEKVQTARVRILANGPTTGRRTWVRAEIRMAGRIAGGLRRQDRVSFRADLERRFTNEPWRVASLRVEQGFSWIGLAPAFERLPGPRPLACPGGVTVADLDGDGHLEAAVLASGRLCRLRIRSGRLESASCVPAPGGPGVALVAGDCDHDDRPDLLLDTGTCYSLREGRLLRSKARPRLRPSPPRRLLLDLDADGHLEHLFLEGSPRLAWPARMHLDDKGRATGSRYLLDATWALGLPSRVCSAAAGDLDGDGGQDLLLLTPHGPLLFRSRLWHGSTVRIRLRGGPDNPFGFGARVQVEANDLARSFLHLPQPGLPARVLTLGIGDAQRARVTVTFPGGRRVGPRLLEAGPKVHVFQVNVAPAPGPQSRTKTLALGPKTLADWRRVLSPSASPKTQAGAWTIVFLAAHPGRHGPFLNRLAAWAQSGGPAVRAVLATPHAMSAPPPIQVWPLTRLPAGPLPRLLVYGPGGRLVRVLLGEPKPEELTRLRTATSRPP